MNRPGSLFLFSATSACVAATLLSACPQQVDDHRQAVIAESIEGLMRPETAAAIEDAAALREASASFCAAPSSAGLDAVQDAWWTLRGPWDRLMVLRLGPIVDSGYDSLVDFWPARPNSVEGGVESGVSTLDELEVLGVASKGLPGFEYMVWDPEAGDEAVLAAYTDADTGAQRCAYLELLAADLEHQLESLQGELDPYFDELYAAGSSERYPTVALAIDELLNGAIAGLHDIRERSLSKPAGFATGDAPQYDLVQSRFSDRSREDLLDTLEGFRRFYLGAEAEGDDAQAAAEGGLGFSVLVSQKSEDIDAEVRAQIDRAIAACEAIPEPLRESLDTDLELIETAWTEVRALVELLTADVAGLLGVTVALTDNDGD
ncbi:imelysin family protein [Pseudenhygromyxa sp. WMMC2535]|uniref:imelysin family protein n=1 Tax=Pseudenhygromyxa sp. WMMC2535 TaxID=2712867 RepID=UPI0015561E67|nr:imelysin family protein [Pseudenhygromyxa sp. WMMC2535]NVB38158.1 imelysin family protein [Pseudenhygromyxa sp. WMMC2535]